MWLVFLLIPLALAGDYVPTNYPNPRKGGFKACNMRSVSNICDPDEILTESERYRLNNELTRLNTRTIQAGKNFCSRKGVDAVLAIIAEGDQQFADDLSHHWALDSQCHKSAVFLLESNERRVYYAGEENTGIDPAVFDSIVYANRVQISSGEFTAGFSNIFKELGKQSSGVDPETEPGNKHKENTKSSNAPLIIVISILSVILTLY